MGHPKIPQAPPAAPPPPPLPPSIATQDVSAQVAASQSAARGAQGFGSTILTDPALSKTGQYAGKSLTGS